MRYRLRTLLIPTIVGAIIGAFTLVPPIWHANNDGWPRAYDFGAAWGGFIGLAAAIAYRAAAAFWKFYKAFPQDEPRS